jgi:exopolysaccharide biosynthesis polyprenyl glycosylphosphotransferase
MRDPQRDVLTVGVRLVDLLVMTSAFAVAALIPYSHDKGLMPFSEFLAIRVKVQNVVLFAGLMFGWSEIFSRFGLYNFRRLSLRSTNLLLDTIKATGLATGVIWLVDLVIPIEVISAGSLIVFWAVTTLVTLSSRIGTRYLLNRVHRSKRNLRNALIVGTNARAIELAIKLESRSELGYKFVGFVDESWACGSEWDTSRFRIVSDFANFAAFLKDQVIDEVFICTPVKSLYDKASQVKAKCEEQGITVSFASDVFSPTQARSHIEQFDESLILTFDTGAMHGTRVSVKRATDFCVSSVLLIFLSPLFLVLALAIKLTSAGPVMFVQERMGLRKRRFRLYKFRTMIADAEQRFADIQHLNEVTGPVFKMKHDPRITQLGKFLRRTSLDELPQLINVLKGEMSLVGPRPLPVRDYEGFSEDWHRRRFSVRPGITGLWQVLGRSSIPFERWMELDMQYIDQWSLLLDAKIIMRTIPAVMRGSGAA